MSLISGSQSLNLWQLNKRQKRRGSPDQRFLRSLAIEGAGLKPFLNDDECHILDLLTEDIRDLSVEIHHLTRTIKVSGTVIESDLWAALTNARELTLALVIDLKTYAGHGLQRRRQLSDKVSSQP